MSQSPKIDEPNSEQLNSFCVRAGNGYNIFIIYLYIILPMVVLSQKLVELFVRSFTQKNASFADRKYHDLWGKLWHFLGETMAFSVS